MGKPYYDRESLQYLAEEFVSLKNVRTDLMAEFLSHSFQTELGKEHAHHGFMRRLSILWKCVENTFLVLPPELDSTPSLDASSDATIYLHAFYINLTGALDNLGWILSSELRIRDDKGATIQKRHVGIRPSNTLVRSKLTEEFRRRLEDFDNWFSHIDNFRDALAHRIPLYVAPHAVRDADQEKYLELERSIHGALLSGDAPLFNDLQNQQHDLEFFLPWFAHSFSEASPHVVIHPQMLIDLNTITILGRAVLLELTKDDLS